MPLQREVDKFSAVGGKETREEIGSGAVQDHLLQQQRRPDLRCRHHLLTVQGDYDYDNSTHEEEEEESSPEVTGGFDTTVALFNGGDFHTCHEVVEDLLYTAEKPTRTLLHGHLRCVVGFHYLFDHNHRGAIIGLREGLCKLHKLRFDDDDDTTMIHLCRFLVEVAVALNFICRTQKELTTCTSDLCLTMDGSASSYQLLGNFAKGQQLYRLLVQADRDGIPSIVFSAASDSRVKLPTLSATKQHLAALQCTCEYI
ncbi:uncharacterized protein LOC102710834 [Oryza brachyantha]|uniref:uncharacterized protein LOC102710834 n=1 Tax=Oryza brachyantha TaxID=4533 RepID=UPI0003EADF57|nr:uncharacterized protein LOC102710834 [Oryza brachyantha]